MDGLIIKSPWIDKVLKGEKTWELRSSKTTKRGEIALIKSGTGTVVGMCELVDVIGPLSIDDIRCNLDKCGMEFKDLESWPFYNKCYAWILVKPKRIEKPISYKHPRGAVIWVKL